MKRVKEKVESLIGKISSVEKMQGALCNDVYCVMTVQGKFIVKIASDELRKKELDNEYKLIKKLENMIDLPKILFYVKENVLSYFVMEFIDGEKPVVFTNDVLQIMAKTLKRIHSETMTNKLVNFDKLLCIAEKNMNTGRLDLNEFNDGKKQIDPKDVLEFLKDNKPKAKSCLLHGDYRPKNMIIKKEKLYVLDWGLSFIGDPYYDLAIIKYYFTDDEFKMFIKFYGIKNIDKKRLSYNEKLASFLNI